MNSKRVLNEEAIHGITNKSSKGDLLCHNGSVRNN